MDELKSRGVEDVLIFTVDGLTGLKEAIQAVSPKSEGQRCIVHQLRNSICILQGNGVKKYPFALKSWHANWDVLSPFFNFPLDIRRIMYMTNIIEGLHRQFRKVTKTKSIFPSDQSLEKMLYLSGQNIMKKWTMRYRNWDMVLNQLAIFFEGKVV